jgi:hypothetical protein
VSSPIVSLMQLASRRPFHSFNFVITVILLCYSPLHAVVSRLAKHTPNLSEILQLNELVTIPVFVIRATYQFSLLIGG